MSCRRCEKGGKRKKGKKKEKKKEEKKKKKNLENVEIQSIQGTQTNKIHGTVSRKFFLSFWVQISQKFLQMDGKLSTKFFVFLDDDQLLGRDIMSLNKLEIFFLSFCLFVFLSFVFCFCFCSVVLFC